VLNQDIINNNVIERPANCLETVKEGLGALAEEKDCKNVAFFVEQCTLHIQALLEETSADASPSENVLRLATTLLNPAPMLKREVILWLKGISRRLGGRRSIRNPFYAEITRNTPYEIFSVILKMVRRLDGFVEPFCFCSENKKANIISFTSVCLVNELFALLSGFSKDDVAGYFKRSFTGSRKGHTAAIIVTKVKDFAITYKKRSGKLVIGFNYGEWNVNGFPQHIHASDV
jgi:hypothetical protein